MLELIMNYVLYALLITGSYICQGLSIVCDGLDMIVTYLYDAVPETIWNFKEIYIPTWNEWAVGTYQKVRSMIEVSMS